MSLSSAARNTLTAVQRNTLITDQNVHAKNSTNRVSKQPALDLLRAWAFSKPDLVHQQTRLGPSANPTWSISKPACFTYQAISGRTIGMRIILIWSCNAGMHDIMLNSMLIQLLKGHNNAEN